MKKLTTLILICAAAFAANAQYGQRLFYNAVSTLTMERFNDGIYSTLNLSGGLPTYSGVGRADSNGIVHSRYVRISNTGGVLNNRLNMYNIFSTPISTKLESICERNLTPYNNVMAGSAFSAFGIAAVPGGSDILISRSTATGVLNSAIMIDLGAGGYDEAACIKPAVFPTYTGKNIVCGYTHQGTTTKAFVMKTTANGYGVSWVRYYDLVCSSGLNAQTYATSLIENPTNGNIYVVGYMTDNNNGGCDNGFISRFSAAGVHLNTWIYNESGTTNGLRFNSIKAVPTSPGNYIIGGDFIQYNTANLNFDPKPYVMTVNLAGILPVVSISQALDPLTTPGSINYASGEDVTSRYNTNTSAFEYFIAGKFILGGSTATDGYIIKMAQTGLPIVSQRYGNTGVDAFHAIDAVGNGTAVNDGLAAFGEYVDVTSSSFPRGCYWVKPYYNLVTGCFQNILNPTVIPISLNATSFVPTLGSAFAVLTPSWIQVNCLTKKLCMSAAIGGGSNLKQSISEEDAQNINVYPSPATDVLNIDFESMANSAVEIQVLDITGKIVMNQHSSIEEGSNSLVLNIQKLGSGIYMLQIKDGEQQIHRKFVKQ